MLELLEEQLTGLRDDHTMPKVIRTAAIAALLIIGKYYALTDDTDVYRIAISNYVPDQKLEWFNSNPAWRPEDRAEADRIVRQRFAETYASRGGETAAPAAAPTKPVKKWASTSRITAHTAHPPDSIEAYLATPLMQESDLTLSEAEGGYRAGLLLYWEKALSTRPRLAQMALDYLSAPGNIFCIHPLRLS
ncbi:hypothetical protein B0H13DRAFT_2337786 [Mycena leptocephala]|nr:hypothetical protein B0H13DRAFT_2337786 [Mycena leptocephala]